MSFDTERFISVVESRRAIWDLARSDYANRELKKSQWEEVVELFGGEGLPEASKKDLDCPNASSPTMKYGTVGEICPDVELVYFKPFLPRRDISPKKMEKYQKLLRERGKKIEKH
ncbi:uncharacterized protein LOC110830580 isoform X2 [Zootermopsis nevadensis]|uniref:uncharacterized protein LOC110830580 isoform X2 n=1 Tax=Zootermopsis nevadensis TaxID=136037 RepID=UPI000B8E7912|nr:uncharacterized protein LOC110830580 isoform X2 [Zootermopsis nevadensis]